MKQQQQQQQEKKGQKKRETRNYVKKVVDFFGHIRVLSAIIENIRAFISDYDMSYKNYSKNIFRSGNRQK